MKFSLTIQSGNEAWLRENLVEVLKVVVRDIDVECNEGRVCDSGGKIVGEWCLSDEDETAFKGGT